MISPPLDVFNATAVKGFLQSCKTADWSWTTGHAECSPLGAARLVLGVLQQQPELRRRYPRAISDGPDGGYCRWLCSEGANMLGLTAAAIANVEETFRLKLGNRCRQLYDCNPDMRRQFPLALTPYGLPLMVRALLHGGKDRHGLRDEEIWWFWCECAEDPHQGVPAVYLRHPAWQERFPLGLTVFGWRQLLAWLREHYRIPPDWLGPLEPPRHFSAIDELRLLYNATALLQAIVPRAFEDTAATQRLMQWLRFAPRPEFAAPPEWWQRLEEELKAGLPQRPGVNVLGHFCYPSGLGQAVRATMGALESAGVRHSCRDVPSSFDYDRPEHADYLGLELFDISLIHLAPEPRMDICYPQSGLAARPGVHRIAVWYWELEAVPAEWVGHAQHFQEIWAPTRFIAEAMTPVMPVPVVHMLPGVQLSEVPSLPRRHFGLPEDRLLFLFAFDMCSVMERKNPLALIRAYQRAFRPDDRAALAIKVSRGEFDRANLHRLTQAAEAAGVTVIDRVMSRQESYALLKACDCYVSLHRSEGFGLSLAEAMLLGKPVIGTAYSGNLDFMTSDNSLLVGYQRVPITQELQFYRRGCMWAEPAEDEAAVQMRWVYEHPQEAKVLGEKARAAASKLLSYEAVGQRMLRRLQVLQSNRSQCRPAA